MRTETQSTPDIVDVPTNSGFNAGDLVYLQNNDYKRLSGPTTATFPSNIDMESSLGMPSLNYVKQVFDNTVSPSYAKNGGSVGKSAAVLTNGNIVHVLVNPQNNRPAFCIKDSAGTDVVAITEISTSLTMDYPIINVCALVGGNFAVSWANSNSLYVSIYNSTGSQVLVPTLVFGTMYSTSVTTFNCTALPNGNFVLVYPNTSGYVSARVYGPTGTAISSNTLMQSSIPDNYLPISVTARSDSTFVVAWKQTGTTSLYYSVCTAAGAVTTSNNFTSSFASTLYSVVVSTKPNDVVVIAYLCNNSSSQVVIALRELSTGNVLGSETLLPNANFFQRSGSSMDPTAINMLFLSNGNYILMFQDKTAAVAYAFFDSTGTCLSGTNANGMIPKYIPGVYIARQVNFLHLVEYGDYVNLYFCPAMANSITPAFFQNVVKINKTTFNLYTPNTASGFLANTTLATGSYAESGSNPTSAKFYTASTQTLEVSSPMQIKVGPVTSYLATGNAAGEYREACSLTNGNFVLVEQSATSPYPLYASIYDGITGTRITTVTVDTATEQSKHPDIQPTASGGFVVAYAKSTGIISVSTYTSTGSQTNTFSLTSGIITSSVYPVRICETTSGQYALSISNTSGYLSTRIYSKNGVQYFSVDASGIGYNSGLIRSICAGPNDSVIATYFTDANQHRIFKIIKTGNDTWTTYLNNQTFADNNFYLGSKTVVLPCGVIANIAATNTANSYIYLITNGNASVMSTGSAMATYTMYGTWTNQNQSFMSMTSNGSLFQYSISSSNSGANIAGLMGWLNGSTSQYPSSNFTVPTGMTRNTDIAEIYDIKPHIGNNVLMFYRDGASNAEAIIVNALPNAVNYTYTAGVSTSQSIPVYQSNTSTSPAIQNTELAGVALTSASAGSTGKLITKGIASLNSNYPSTGSGAFDYQSYNKTGVKGTYSGRTVNLMGKD